MRTTIIHNELYINFTKDGTYQVCPAYIRLGNEQGLAWNLYLQFNLGMISEHARIGKAELVMYEIPSNQTAEKAYYYYSIMPAKYYTNPYYMYRRSWSQLVTEEEWSMGKQIAYNCNGVVTMDMTRIVTSWINEEQMNYGCLMELLEYETHTMVGTHIRAFQPILRVTYSEPDAKILYCHESSVTLPTNAQI